jgi:hypothetical protein
METFFLHSHPGSVLIIEPFNTASVVGSATPPEEFVVRDQDLVAHGKATYTWHPRTQILERRRVWSFPNGGEQVTDGFKLRLLFCEEIRSFLVRHGFAVVETFEKQRSRIYPETLYIVASHENSSGGDHGE